MGTFRQKSRSRAKEKRLEVPPAVAARVLFLSDRTCCVCRAKGKPVQIHHVDDNPSNSAPANLAVLCLGCHTETQLRGGFHRKLDAEQVLLYRDDWLMVVARERATARGTAMDERISDQADLELATSLAEIYREAQAYDLLAMHYLTLGNVELRDKYIDLAIKAGIDDSSVIFFRAEQGRQDLIPPNLVAREERRLKRHKDFFQLARFFRQLSRPVDAVLATCQGAVESIKEGNLFSAAIYLKEMTTDGDITRLFELEFERSRKANDLWWQLRALQEMEMDTEADELLKANKHDIERSGDVLLRQQLALAENDEKRFIELSKQEAQEECDSLNKPAARPNKRMEPTRS